MLAESSRTLMAINKEAKQNASSAPAANKIPLPRTALRREQWSLCCGEIFTLTQSVAFVRRAFHLLLLPWHKYGTVAYVWHCI